MKDRDRRALWVLGLFLIPVLLWNLNSRRYHGVSSVGVTVTDLRHRDEEQRMEARDALFTLGTNAVPALLRYYTAQESAWHGWVRRWLPFIRLRSSAAHDRQIGYEGLRALGVQASSASSNLVQEVLLTRRRTGQSASLLISIGPAALPEVVAAVPVSGPSARLELLSVLGSYGPRAAAATPLITRYLSDPDGSVRQTAAIALGQIGSDAPLVVPALARLLSDTNQQVRSAAMQAFVNYGSNSTPAVPDLMRLASATSLDDPERLEIAACLVATGDTDVARKDVLSLLESGNPTNRAWAVTALADVRISAREIARHAARFLNDAIPELAAASAAQLGRAVRETGYPQSFVDAGLGAASTDARLAFLKEAFKPDHSIIPHTIHAMADPDARLRLAAAQSLIGMDPPALAAQPALGTLLDDPDGKVRLTAYHALHNTDSDLFPMPYQWPPGRTVEGQVFAVAKLHLFGPKAVDTNLLASARTNLSGGFAHSLAIAYGRERTQDLQGLKSLVGSSEDLAAMEATQALLRLSRDRPDARQALFEALVMVRTGGHGVAMAFAFGKPPPQGQQFWLDLVEAAGAPIRRLALQHLLVEQLEDRERAIPVLRKAALDPDPNIAALASGVLRRVAPEFALPNAPKAPAAKKANRP